MSNGTLVYRTCNACGKGYQELAAGGRPRAKGFLRRETFTVKVHDSAPGTFTVHSCSMECARKLLGAIEKRLEERAEKYNATNRVPK